MDTLTTLNTEGITIILVTHEPDVARYARRAIMMKDGLILSDRRNEGVPGDRPVPSEAGV